MKRTSLKWRIVIILLTVSLTPLCLMGVGAWVVFGGLLEEKSLELQGTLVQSHAQAIDSYLTERVHLLQQITSTHSLGRVIEPGSLDALFDGLNQVSKGGFVDLGVIDAQGGHRKYVGPYDLEDRNYSDAEWFRDAMTEGVHISDVFLGYREEPHCVIAVKAGGGSEPWILRATINSNQFDAIVRAESLGKTGDAFIINRGGFFQTSPRVGTVLDPAGLPAFEFHRGVREHHVKVDGIKKIQATTWLNGNRWVLVVQQDAVEIHAPVTRAMTSGGLLMALAVVLVAITTFLATGHLTAKIDKANAQREEMFSAFMRSAKLASIGELATGLAHEINNPLAIISAEQTNIRDVVEGLEDRPELRNELDDSTERIKKQVQRCASITTKMLQFGRNAESTMEPTEVGPRLKEIVNLLTRQAGVRNVELQLEVEDGLPTVMVDPLELEQVLVNLVNNAFYALPRGGNVRLRARRTERELFLEICDNGCGIEPDVLDRIFEPFFTTKPVGQGTGLGMSICYGIVQSWGGRIEAESEPGRGTTIRIRLPLQG